jgi:hypothetical protein
MVSGLVGDIPTPVFAAVGAYVGAFTFGSSNKLTVLLGRRARSDAGTRLSAQLLDAYNTPITGVLDSSSFGGCYASANMASMGGPYTPFLISATIAAQRGIYHLFMRAQTANATPSKVTIQPMLVTADGVGEAYVNGYDLNQGPAQTPFSAQNTWTIGDAGQITIPTAPRTTLTDLTQRYAITSPMITDGNVSPAAAKLNWSLLLPVDSSLSTMTLTPTFFFTPKWLWTLVDGASVNTASGSGSTAANVDLETSALYNPVNAASGPGSYLSSTGGLVNSQVAINQATDPFVTLDPTLATPNASGVNQFALMITDQSATVYAVVCEFQYAPLYLTLR